MCSLQASRLSTLIVQRVEWCRMPDWSSHAGLGKSALLSVACLTLVSVRMQHQTIETSYTRHQVASLFKYLGCLYHLGVVV
jgi:hypothetical protein